MGALSAPPRSGFVQPLHAANRRLAAGFMFARQPGGGWRKTLGNMTANQLLLWFILGFWVLLYLALKLENLLRGRRFSDGPSLIPVVPIFPLIAFGLGVALNDAKSPWGTIVVIALHAGFLMFGLISIWMHPSKPAK